MQVNRLSWGALFASVIATAGGCQIFDRGSPDQMPFVVTAQERALAVELLGNEDSFRVMMDVGPAYLVDIEVLRDKNGTGDREFLVTHYRTQGDVAILSRINLSRSTVTSVEAVPHLPVPLSKEEFETARRMALADPVVKEFIAGHTVQVEAQVSRTFDEGDPTFGHRIVNLLFKTPQGYLEIPLVTVDLTAKAVMVSKGEGR